MLYTSSEANKTLRAKNDQIDQLITAANKSVVFSVVSADDPEDFRPKYDFLESEKQIATLMQQVRTIKHAINQFNSSTFIDELGMTIDELLVALPQWNKRLSFYEELLYRRPKALKNSYNGTPVYEYINYNLDDAKQAYDLMAERIADAQVILDRINNTIEFDIPIEL